MVVPSHKLSNTYLGNVADFEEYGIYVFFSHLYYDDRLTNFITADQLMRFLNLL